MTKDEKSFADVALNGLLEGKQDYCVFYKYQSITEYSLDSLKSGYIYTSTYSQLNDPFDPFISLISRATDHKLVNAINQKGPRVFCVTPDCNSPLMWAHYANAHAGMCVGYAAFVGNPRLLNPVKYVSSLPDTVSILDVMLMKQKEWSYEKEWRLTWSTNDPKATGLMHPVSMMLGAKCTDRDRLRVEEVMPDTISHYAVKAPGLENGNFVLEDYDVKEIIDEFGRLPTLSDLEHYEAASSEDDTP